ncbi:MAG TPA: TadE/TadG family type IV pilus assembly protein [Polyangia bacterium]|jgi:Flp pilus assembly protein TadG|nr:TadE/TadG family type IV pilus assembly protein [Polyangia bacterium]
MRRRRGRARERGAAVIEFALTLPLLVPLMLFMIEYGHYFWVTLNAVEAAKMGLAAAVTQNNTTPATSCADTTNVPIVTLAGQAAAVLYFTTNTPSLVSVATPTVTCVSGTINGATVTNPSWQIIVKMDFRPLIGFRLRWLHASTTLSGGITYSTPALIRTL